MEGTIEIKSIRHVTPKIYMAASISKGEIFPLFRENVTIRIKGIKKFNKKTTGLMQNPKPIKKPANRELLKFKKQSDLIR